MQPHCGIRATAVIHGDENAAVNRTLVVTFHRHDGRVPLAWWEAIRPTRGRVVGGHMPIGRGRIPHDMAHLAVESHFGIVDGFWGLLARGATFEHGTRQRPTQPGRRLIREYRVELVDAEALGNEHHAAWRDGRPTPVAPTFDRLAALWDATADGGALTLRWPTLEVVADDVRAVAGG